MSRPNPAQVARAGQLLAYEGAADSVADGKTTAAGRIYDKLHAHLAPIMGDAGVQVLFVRSAKLTRGEFACHAEAPLLEGATKLRECLHARDPAVATESATLLFGNFFALIATFIGERLTTEVLRRAWPMLDEIAPRETSK